jgi:hypothetical protein
VSLLLQFILNGLCKSYSDQLKCSLGNNWNNKATSVTNLMEQIKLEVRPYMFRSLEASLRGTAIKGN